MTIGIARRVTAFCRDRGKSGMNLRARLAPREKELLVLLSRGYQEGLEIAAKLSLSLETIPSYLKTAYENMQMHPARRRWPKYRYFLSGSNTHVDG